MSAITADRVVQNVLKIGVLVGVIAIIALIAGLVTGAGEVGVLTQAGVFLLAAWAVAFIVSLLMAARRHRGR